MRLEKEAYDRAQAHNKQVFARVGWRQMIISMIEKGWLKRPDMSALESVYRANFEQVVGLISTENASY